MSDELQSKINIFWIKLSDEDKITFTEEGMKFGSHSIYVGVKDDIAKFYSYADHEVYGNITLKNFVRQNIPSNCNTFWWMLEAWMWEYLDHIWTPKSKGGWGYYLSCSMKHHWNTNRKHALIDAALFIQNKE